MKVLITGARGMVGRNLVENPRMKAFDLLTPSRYDLDLLNFEGVESYLMQVKPDLIVHAAGRVGGIQANMKNPVAFLVENLDINRNLILAARKVGVRRLLNLGSSCMYPRNAENPLRESMILQGELEPTNEGYALAKITAQRLCQYIAKEDAIFEYKTLIPCNLYGRFDKFDPSHSHMVPAVIHKMHTAKSEGKSEIDIWGDGLARREFMYAGDLADCISRAIERFADLPEVMNVGLGYDYSINEYYQAIADVVGFKGSFRHDLSKPIGMRQKLVSVERQQAWGWKSRVSLHEGIEHTYRYYLDLLSGASEAWIS